MIGTALALLLFGATPDSRAASPADAACIGQDIAVDRAFESAAFAACTIAADGMVTLDIRPETEPINPSPWYAARLTQGSAVVRRVTLSYHGAGHRYQPWFSTDGQNWQKLAIETGGAPERVSVALPAFSGSAFLSAQPLMPLSSIMQRWSARVTDGVIAPLPSAQSIDGRPVPLFRAGPADARVAHLVTARQHPPETTGAVAFDAFAGHLLDRMAQPSCGGQAVLFAPILNPDGIARGHWRTNAGLVDLNRDWGRFSQPETAAVGGILADQARTASIASVIDFHSTRRGAIYVSRATDNRAATFAEAVATRTGLAVVPTRAGGGNTLKSWSEDRFGSASFTVELPDDASPHDAERVGAAIAELFALHFLCSDTGVSR